MVAENKNDTVLFWGCFIALVTTAFGFVGRLFLIDVWAAEFELDAAQTGRLAGIGIWPFAVSIIGFSLLIDRIGYKTSMYFAFLGHIIWAIMGVSAFYVEDKATGYQLLYWGSLILALGNGTVEAFINPVVATMFSKDKTKWLNILHAGWPGGLVFAGMISIFINDVPWSFKVGVIAIPAVVYFAILVTRKFPVSERVATGVGYREMLQEFGILGAMIVATLLSLQLMDFFSNGSTKELSALQLTSFAGIGIALVVAFGIYTKSLGRPLMFLLVLIMMPLATTEIGTDGWITTIMGSIAQENNFHPGWVLVYTSVIMVVLRFYAGPIVHKFTPLGLLAVSAVLAIVGLYTLSITTGLAIFLAATLYGLGKTFFWPTMLGVVSEQCPKGGALTLNAISGIGMLAVGTLGFPYIGTLKIDKENTALVATDDDQSVAIQKSLPDLVKDGKLTVLTEKSSYEIIKYEAIDDKQLAAMIAAYPQDNRRKEIVEELEDPDKQKKLEEILAGLSLADKDAVDEVIMAAENDDQSKVAGLFGKLTEGMETPAKQELDGLLAGLESKEELQSVVLRQAALSFNIGAVRSRSSQGALANMTVFPIIMLIGYLCLIGYFKSKGGYKPVEIAAADAPAADPPANAEG